MYAGPMTSQDVARIRRQWVWTCFCIVQKYYPEACCGQFTVFHGRVVWVLGVGVEGSSLGCAQRMGWGAPHPARSQLSCMVSPRGPHVLSKDWS